MKPVAILLTYKEAAAYLAISYNTLRRLIKDGKISCIRLGPKTVRVAKDDLDRFIRGLSDT